MEYHALHALRGKLPFRRSGAVKLAHRAGYEGDLWVGYRGALPGWIVDSPAFDRTNGHSR
jgi:hypothetical protein